jgi:MFS family permease
MWAVIGLSKNPYELIILLCTQSVFSALIVLSWTDLFVNSTSSHRRGEIIGKLNWYNGIGALLSTLASGYILTHYGFVNFIFFIATIFGIIGATNFFSFATLRPFRLPAFKIRIKENLLRLKENKDFLVLLKAKMFLSFAVGIAGPFFTIQVVTNLRGSLMDVAILSVINLICRLLVYKPWGFIVDYVGRRAVILSCIFLISTYPLVYAIAPNILFLYFFVIFGAIGWAGFNIAAFAYFSDTIKKQNVFELTAFYNFFVEMCGVMSKFLGGIIAQWFGMFTVFVISFFLRLSTLIFFASLKEKTGYEETVKLETSLHPFYFIGNSMTIYSILFSTLRRDLMRRRKRLIDRLQQFFEYLFKKLK